MNRSSDPIFGEIAPTPRPTWQAALLVALLLSVPAYLVVQGIVWAFSP
ncbi:hypothetical protein [Poseidonocella pacifica]|nr:hypothetical protein [Poseidonocella pacifica]